ncbi:MAG: hypothetical protein HY321_22850, partial [Armatimonadetes bacterium]|nr:hypothetical protein [Armatimonadota bacterium]
GELPARLSALDRAREIVAYCHHGVRSAQAVRILRRAGFDRVSHLRGGIAAWAAEVAPEMPRY